MVAVTCSASCVMAIQCSPSFSSPPQILLFSDKIIGDTMLLIFLPHICIFSSCQKQDHRTLSCLFSFPCCGWEVVWCWLSFRDPSAEPSPAHNSRHRADPREVAAPEYSWEAWSALEAFPPEGFAPRHRFPA